MLNIFFLISHIQVVLVSSIVNLITLIYNVFCHFPKFIKKKTEMLKYYVMHLSDTKESKSLKVSTENI